MPIHYPHYLQSYSHIIYCKILTGYQFETHQKIKNCRNSGMIYKVQLALESILNPAEGCYYFSISVSNGFVRVLRCSLSELHTPYAAQKKMTSIGASRAPAACKRNTKPLHVALGTTSGLFHRFTKNTTTSSKHCVSARAC